MPLGSSSDAPVIRPGPSTRRTLSFKVSGALRGLAPRAAFGGGDDFIGKPAKTADNSEICASLRRRFRNGRDHRFDAQLLWRQQFRKHVGHPPAVEPA